MKLMRTWIALISVFALVGGAALASDQQAKTKTCCQEAAEKGKECRHRCCLAAHKEGKSCQKCNPNKEDLELKKDTKK